MPRIEWMGQSAVDPDNTWANTARLINCFREPVGDQQWVLKGVLGTAAFSTLTGVFIRAMGVVDGVLYAAHGGRLWKVSSRGTATDLGAITDSADTSISGNNGKVTVAAGGDYFVWDGTNLTQPTAGAFSAFGSVTFFGQRTFLTEKDGRRVQWSDVADPTTLNALRFATTESRDDNNLRALPVGGVLWIFKEASIERWAQIDENNYAAIPGSTIEIGLKGYSLLCPFPDGAFFVGADNRAYIAGGGDIRPVSPIPVNTSLATENPERVLHYKDEGHDMLAIVFPDRPAWVYCLTTGEWHERASVAGSGAWAIKTAAGAYGAFYGCDDLGNVVHLVRNNVDGADPLIKTAISRTLDFQGERRRVAMLRMRGRVGRTTLDFELESETSVLGLGGDDVLDVASDAPLELALQRRRAEPMIDVAASGDNAHTWGPPRTIGIGNLGDYERQLTTHAWGQFRQVSFRVRWSGAYDVTIASAADVRLV